MKVHQPGVLESSDIFFYTRSALAARMYFYPLCVGHYLCDRNYTVDRQSYDSFLVMYVQSGNGYVECGGKVQPIKAGSLALIDCYLPHRYYTHSEWEIYWLHFDGPLAREYFWQATAEGNVITPQNPYNSAKNLTRIFEYFQENRKISEAQVSSRITNLLTELILATAATATPENRADTMEDTLVYISEHAAENLTLEHLAQRVNLSPFYFTRVFKRETGFTPHEYLIQVRVNLAKFYLKTTDLPLKMLYFQCGFNSECSFCTCFKKNVGQTPGNFRKDLSVAPWSENHL